MHIELINTGSELMSGRRVNSHHPWIASQLASLGLTLARQICIADEAPLIIAELRQALKRSNLVVMTGGLGPTSDDLTRPALARLLKVPLRLNRELLQKITGYFRGRGKSIPPGVEVQALVPQGAILLPNDWGTAPGLRLRTNLRAGGTCWLILLPGPPRELYPIFNRSVLPWLQGRISKKDSARQRIFRTIGLGESLLAAKIELPLSDLVKEGLEIGYCARIGEVDLSLTARGKLAERLIEGAAKQITPLIGEYIYGEGDETLESVLVKMLAGQNKTVALAESCTGGHLANLLTNVPGASAVFAGSAVTYSNQSKTRLLRVPQKILMAEGAVSAATVAAMAEGALELYQADFALSVSGIAGPGGGTEAKPVGTVFLGLARRGQPTLTRKKFNPFDRETFKRVTSLQALDWLRREI